MKKIGIDFGTTNSIISYYDPDQNILKEYKVSAGNDAYIPSVVAYGTRHGKKEILYGKQARSRIGSKKYDVFQQFKLFLGADDSKQAANGFVGSNAADITRDYLRSLYLDYQKKQGLNVEGAIVTVPEIWIREQAHMDDRSKLKDICSNIGLPLIKLVSEPVAACAYFCYCFERKNNKPYEGHILVIDYGGGTLDLSLCEATNKKKLRILHSTGYGDHEELVGRAGVAFDTEAVKKVYENNSEELLSKTNPKFFKLLYEFESLKIENESRICDDMRMYLKDADLADGIEPLFEINDNSIPVYCKELYEAFSIVNENDLKNSIADMRKVFSKFNVDEDSIDRFRILLVGGFSNFYLVEHTVRELFNSKIGSDDKRFDMCFNNIDRSLAISKGAAVVANGLYSVLSTSPFSMGIRIGVMQNDPNTNIPIIEMKDIAFWNLGDKITEGGEVKYSSIDVEFSIDKKLASSLNLTIFIGDNPNRKYFKIEESFYELLPENIPSKGTVSGKIGFYLDENLIGKLYIKINDKEKATPLGQVLERYMTPVMKSN